MRTVFPGVMGVLVSLGMVRGEDVCGGPRGHRRNYTDYSVLSITASLDSSNIAFLSKRVDFWTSPRQNGTDVTFLVGPRHLEDVRKHLKKHNIKAKTIFKNFQDEIERENKENSYCREQSKSTKIKHHIMKRQSIWDDILDMFIGSTSSSQRKPRKINDDSHTVNDLRESRFLVSGSMDWHHYHPLPTIYSWLERLASSNPRVRLEVVGVTEEGRKLVVVHVGGERRGKPVIFIEGGIHAREWISPATVTFILRELVTNSAYNHLVDMYHWVIMPVVNPDGYVYTHTTDRMWRKNRGTSETLLNLISHCKGVDLNRNFAYNWGEDLSFLRANGGTPLPCLETFIGDSAFSEPESQAVRNVVLRYGQRMVAYLSYHSFGQKILYPWSYTQEKVHDYIELHHMANTLASGIYDSSGGDFYQIGTAADIQYSASGGSDDWARGVGGIKWVYLIELPDSQHGFLLPTRRILPVASSNMEGLNRLASAIYETL